MQINLAIVLRNKKKKRKKKNLLPIGKIVAKNIKEQITCNAKPLPSFK